MSLVRIRRGWLTSAAWIAALTLTSFSSRAQGENWPSWRGPLGNGISADTKAPTQWSAEKNVAWRIPMPGQSGATPAVWEDKIFVTSVDGKKLVLICVGTDGKQHWKRTVAVGDKVVRGDEGNRASPSAVTDGQHVWSLMGGGDVACFDMDGNEKWKLNLQDRYGKLNIAFGLSSTPVVHEDAIFFQMIHGDGKAQTEEAVVVALEKTSGKEIWHKKRLTGATNENEHSYASPILYNFGGVAYLITHGADFTVAYELADGAERWRLGGLNPHDDPNKRYHPTLRFVASPAAAEGIVVSPTAKNGPIFAIRADQRGDLTGKSSARHWVRTRNTPDVPSPLIAGGLVYICREQGVLLCLDQKTGKEIYEERLHDHRHRASPVLINGNIYLTARDGRVTVVKAGNEFEIIAQNDVDEQLAASPAVSNGTIYLRTFDSLWAIRAQ
jgi:outer membrane protein assembly factor BamB